MPRYRITGRRPLRGTLEVSGRKNAAIKLLAGSLLTTGTVTLTRVPDIADVRVMIELLRSLGAHVEHEGDRVMVNTASVTATEIPYDLGRKLRASLVLVGPLLARFGTVRFPHPGGCVIGKRSIDPHLDGFRALGAHVDFDGTYYTLSGALQGTLVYLKEKSVTGTENLMMASVLATGETRIFNAAEEDHIVTLADFLRKLGYQTSGDGSRLITLIGSTLSSADIHHEIIADEIEVGTFAVASYITGGEITLTRVGPCLGILPILSKLDEFNAPYTFNEANETLTFHPAERLAAADIQTNPFPGFFPDLQSPFTVLATQAHGESAIHDWMYDGRLTFTDLLIRMGADIVMHNPHEVTVKGPTPLRRAHNASPDLRAGAALVLAALAAEGESTVEHIEIIERGYVRLDERLRSLGAEIIREDE